MKKGILLINLGSPDSPSRADVKKYLREFLMDKRVVDLPYFLRFILVEGAILPFRPKSSAEAYHSIWTKEGSPLIIHTQNTAKKLQKKLGNNYKVAYGMRYGNPSIKSGLNELEDCNELVIIPLFPEYSSAATGSPMEEALEHLKTRTTIPGFTIIRDFYTNELFIEAYAQQIKAIPAEHYLFSYHGLPERQITNAGCSKVCDPVCKPITDKNEFCYRAQCYQTTRLLAAKLELNQSQYTQSFQSRLGKTPWIQPYTDKTIEALAKKGIKDLAVVCPSFVADCLETLEEIGIQGNKQWQSLTGNPLKVIPCINDSDLFIDALQAMVLTQQAYPPPSKQSR